MDLSPLLPWLIIAHVLSVIGFAATHGSSMFLSFRLRGERDLGRIQAQLMSSGTSMRSMYLFLLLVLVTGILAGIAGGWWTSGRLWLWTAIAVLVVVIGAMYALGTNHVNAVRHAAGAPTFEDIRKGHAPPPPDEAALGVLLTSTKPLQVGLLGIAGLAAIVWLMIAKPF